MAKGRAVVDTNILVSRLLFPRSTPGRAVRKILGEGQLLASNATLTELADVLSRPKFGPYVSIADRQGFLRRLARFVEMVPITYTVRACRDPDDDKFLELALNGDAEVIVTGDRDLLVLSPFRGVRIVTPATYLR